MLTHTQSSVINGTMTLSQSRHVPLVCVSCTRPLLHLIFYTHDLLAAGATSHQHPPDFDPEELDFASGRDSFVQDDSTEFGVSLLIPNGDNANETTSLGGVDVPSMQFLELRCSVINVTQRTFTM